MEVEHEGVSRGLNAFAEGQDVAEVLAGVGVAVGAGVLFGIHEEAYAHEVESLAARVVEEVAHVVAGAVEVFGAGVFVFGKQGDVAAGIVACQRGEQRCGCH
jgi:hypothetical protein